MFYSFKFQTLLCLLCSLAVCHIADSKLMLRPSHLPEHVTRNSINHDVTDYTYDVINPNKNEITDNFFDKSKLVNEENGWKPIPYTNPSKYRKPRHMNYRIISHNPHKNELKTILSQQILKMNHMNQPPGNSVIQIAPSNVKLYHPKVPTFTYTDFPFFDLFFKEEQNAKDLSSYMKNSYYSENPIDHMMMKHIKYKIPKHEVKIRPKKYIKYNKIEPPKKMIKLSAPTDLTPFAFQSQFPKMQEEYDAAFNSFVNNNYNSFANKNFGSINVEKPIPFNVESIQNYTHQNNSQIQSSSNIKHTLENKLNKTADKFIPSTLINVQEIKSNPNYKINGYSSFISPNVNISYKYETPLNNKNKSHSILKTTYIQNTPVVHVPIYHNNNNNKQREKQVELTPKFSPHIQIEIPQNVQTLHNIPQFVPNTQDINSQFDKQTSTRINLHNADNNNNKEFIHQNKNLFLKNQRGKPKQFISNMQNTNNPTSNFHLSNNNNNKSELRKDRKNLKKHRGKLNMNTAYEQPVTNTKNNNKDIQLNHFPSNTRESHKNQQLNHQDLNQDFAVQPEPHKITTSEHERNPSSNVHTTDTKELLKVKNPFLKYSHDPAPVYEETGEYHPSDWKFEYKKIKQAKS